jgi:ABC-type transport system substrate-binding protein/DNA-binding SARP family transcriptional activator
MDLFLLGPIEARLDDRPIALGTRKERAVLAMLGLEVGHTVSADRLAIGLWGERAPPSGPKLVQLYVSHLRRSLEGNGAQITTRGRGYELTLVGGEVDAVRFERLLEQGHAREALALWRGDPLSDVADEPFAVAEIRRLEDLRVRAAERAIDDDIAAGHHCDVIAELDALIDEHPLREHLHAQRMLALYRAGRQAEALDAYRRARALLVDEIGVEPGPELQQLHAAVLAQDPALDRGGAAAPPSPARIRSTPRRALLVAGALVLVAGPLAFGISRLSRSSGLGRLAENSVGVIEADSGLITKEYAVGRGPSAVTAGGGSVWVANTLDGTVTRIDRDGDVGTIPVRGAPAALAFGAGSLWVADSESRKVVQVDPGANKVARRYEVGEAPRALAVADGALWVLSGPEAAIKRIDLGRRRGPERVPLTATPTAIAAGAGALWVASEEAGTVTRVEPGSGVAGQPIPVGDGPSAVAVGAGAVWVANRHGGTLTRIDPAKRSVSWTIGVGSDPSAVTVDAGAVWVAGGDDGTVTRVDPHARTLMTIDVGPSSTAIAAAGGRVWTTAGVAAAAHRGGTLRVLYTTPPPGPSIDWLSAAGYYWVTFQVTSLAYDGLVAYRRVHGASGSTIVGGLATEAPAPSPDGRTYIFTLRSGLRYSDGSPVRPEDFRTSLERFLRVTRGSLPAFYDAIVGARRCVRQPKRCDLSAGIVTDPASRTITVHLTRPDGDLLHKLTLPFAYVVPGSTPVRRTGDRPLPGTGPYRITAWTLGRGGRLERNPYFRSGSRPSGFVDRIELHNRPAGHISKEIADVEHNAADVAYLASAFSSFVGREQLDRLGARAPGQLHSEPIAGAEWMFLNVRRRPFDDVDVRRALNYATDRRRMVKLVGGANVAAATCQFVPPGLQGHEPYCRYGAAPDLPRARRLVAASGTAGLRIVVWAPSSRTVVGRYFVDLLDDLGFRASLRVEDDYPMFELLREPRTRAQMGLQPWVSDYLSASNFIEPGFGCVPRAARPAWNLSYFCDPVVTREIREALAAQGAAAARHWTEADHRLVAEAPAVPLTTPRDLVFVSKRTGNVQHHLQWSTLFDQLWVR